MRVVSHCGFELTKFLAATKLKIVDVKRLRMFRAGCTGKVAPETDTSADQAHAFTTRNP